jgi:hypothetical protein
MIKPKSERVRKWFTGTFIAAITATLIQVLTGAFTSVGTRVRQLITNDSPIQAAVASDLVSFERQSDLSYVIPKRVEQLPPAPTYPEEMQQIDEWATSLGGVDAYNTDVLVTIQGRTATPVVLTGLRVNIVERRPPLRGIFVTKPNAGPLDLRYFVVNLDASPPTIVGEDPFGDAPPKFPFQVSQAEPEVFYISASTESCDCTWVAELFWMTNGKTGSTIIDHNGRSFRTTAAPTAGPIYHFGGPQLYRYDRK